MHFFIATLLLILFQYRANAQKADSSDKVTIHIIHATLSEGIQTDSGEVRKFSGDVQFEQNGTYMYCDSAILNATRNFLEAFGNVRIIQPDGTRIQSDYLKYTGNNKLAYLNGNCSLTDGKNNLWCTELYYDVGTKIGTYSQGGTLQSDTTTVSSNSGIYYVNKKEARFTGDVYVTDPQYNVVSDDMGYNTNTKVTRFFGPSIVTNDKSVLHTSNGTWDAKNEVAHFISRSSMMSDEQYIEADTMDYNRKTGFGNAKGKVVAIDTSRKTTLYSGYAEYNEVTKKLRALIKPVMKKMNRDDSLFIRADTFFSAPVPKPGEVKGVDTIRNIVAKKKGKKNIQDTIITIRHPSQSVTDSSEHRYFICYHHVKIFSDSLQAVCDSLSYSQADSTMRLMLKPIVWSRRSQITGDTILLLTDSDKLRQMYVPGNGFMISQSGPDKTKMFDQVQGKTITGNFQNNAITDMLVQPDAECIYFAKDDDGAYIGMSRGTSERMRILFKNEQINSIFFEQDVKQTMTPLNQVNISAAHLDRYQWHPEKRPKSKKELFE